jgi:hypothetical protein
MKKLILILALFTLALSISAKEYPVYTATITASTLPDHAQTFTISDGVTDETYMFFMQEGDPLEPPFLVLLYREGTILTVDDVASGITSKVIQVSQHCTATDLGNGVVELQTTNPSVTIVTDAKALDVTPFQ